MSNYNNNIIAYNTAELAKIKTYGFKYADGTDELFLRYLTYKALMYDDDLGVLTSDEHECLASKMNEPYNN